jgi:signal transduction histidine kinase
MDVSIQESRIFESREQNELMYFKIAPVIASQIEAFHALWPEHVLTYSEHLDNCKIFGDAPQLKLALFNILDNARKYASPNSPIEVECSTENDEVLIKVRNQGKSITHDEGEKYFEKYLRGNNTGNTAGAGLGLWLVRNIVNRHNGRVALEGIPSGVEATVRLPLAAKAT